MASDALERTEEVCSKIWSKILGSQIAKGQDPGVECVSALKAILCIPGALFELQQDAQDHEQHRNRHASREYACAACLFSLQGPRKLNSRPRICHVHSCYSYEITSPGVPMLRETWQLLAQQHMPVHGNWCRCRGAQQLAVCRAARAHLRRPAQRYTF